MHEKKKKRTLKRSTILADFPRTKYVKQNGKERKQSVQCSCLENHKRWFWRSLFRFFVFRFSCLLSRALLSDRFTLLYAGTKKKPTIEDINHKYMTFMFVVIRISKRMVFIATAIDNNRTHKNEKDEEILISFVDSLKLHLSIYHPLWIAGFFFFFARSLVCWSCLLFRAHDHKIQISIWINQPLLNVIVFFCIRVYLLLSWNRFLRIIPFSCPME